MNSRQQEALERAKGFFEYAANHPSMIAFRIKAIEDFGFYDGDGQWPADALKILAERGQTPLTINKIKANIHNIHGLEIKTRSRIAFRSHSNKEDEAIMARALSHLGYAIQENENMPYKASLKFKDALITGIGWSNMYRDPISEVIKYEYVNPLDILYDPDDLTPDMDEMSYICRVRWLPIFRAKTLWPKHAKKFHDMLQDGAPFNQSSQSDELQNRRSAILNNYSSGSSNINGRIMVVEVQYREMRKSYGGYDRQGRYFQTFNIEEAEIIIENPSTMQEKDAEQIMRIVYSGDQLLEFAPLEPRLPDLKDYTYIPCIYGRRFSDGAPDGWLSVMKDPQREINYHRTKIAANINSSQIIMDASVLGEGRTIDDFREELKRPDSIFVKAAEGEIKIQNNQHLTPAQFQILNLTDLEGQQTSGMFNEARGEATNAVSGVAIKARQINSNNNQNFAFDHLRRMKKREGRMMLNLIQGGGDNFLEVQLLDDEEAQTVALNVMHEVDGKTVIANDIRTLPVSISVEEVPDYESSSEEKRAQLIELLNSPYAALVLESPSLLKRLGFRDYKEVPEEIANSRRSKEQETQAGAAQQQQEQVPSPEMQKVDVPAG